MKPRSTATQPKSRRKGPEEVVAAETWPNILNTLLEQHRFYVNRNWQYFGAILLIESLVFNAYAGLAAVPGLSAVVSLASVGLIGIFYHLINWTDMRIDRNAERLNRRLQTVIIEAPQRALDGLIPWMKLGILLAVLPHLFLVIDTGMTFAVGISSLFLILVSSSELIVRKARRRDIPVLDFPLQESD